MKNNMCKELVIKGKDRETQVIVYIEEVKVAKETYMFKLKAINLPSRSFFANLFKSTPRN